MKAPNRDRGPASALAVPSVVGERHAMSQNSPFSSDSGLGSRVLLGLCLVGFFVNCQPSEPFLTRFLIENKGLTEKQLDNTVWPYDTYGSFLFLLPVGIVAEIYGYRRVVLVGLLCREATRVILIFANGVFMMAVMQLTYAAATCANTVYYAYAYQVVAPSKFVRTTGYMRAAYHGGNVAGAIMGQALVDSGEPLLTLFYLSWAFTTIGLVCFVLFLPPPTRPAPPSLASLLLRRGAGRGHRVSSSPSSSSPSHHGNARINNGASEGGGWSQVWTELKRLYTGRRLVQWCTFWAIMFGVHQMISNYYQNQVYAVDVNAKFGYLEAAMEAFATIGAVAAYKSAKFVSMFTGGVIAVGAGATGVCYLLSTLVGGDIVSVSALNVIPMGIFGYMITLASATIATDAITPRYAISFTLNTFVSLGIATIIQQIASSQQLPTNGYYLISAVASFSVAVYGMISGGYLFIFGEGGGGGGGGENEGGEREGKQNPRWQDEYSNHQSSVNSDWKERSIGERKRPPDNDETDADNAAEEDAYQVANSVKIASVGGRRGGGT